MVDPPDVMDSEDQIDTEVNDPATQTLNGVTNGNGDGTVPLTSLGYMCVEGWKNQSQLNPSSLPVTTIEYLHEPDGSIRGGSKTADHVDIIGNFQMTMDIIKLL